MKNVRVGVIGAGWVARERHLPALRAVSGVDLVAVWSRDPDKARQVAAAFDIGRVVERWEEIASAGDLDAVVVATPPVLHAAATIESLRSGKHVLCQGRMARNVTEALEMSAAAKESGKVAALYPPRPGLKGDRVIRRLLSEGFAGDLTEVRVTGMSLAAASDQYSWLSDPEVLGVNAMTLGMWAEVLHRWVGPVARLMAIGRSHRRERRDPGGALVPATVPDSLAISAQLVSGATASFHFSDCASSGPGHSIEIYGTRGALSYRFFPDVLRAAAGGKEMEAVEIAPAEERHHTTDAEFIRAIREGTPVSPDFEDGLRYMEFCEAVAYSLHARMPVDLPLTAPLMEQWASPLGHSKTNE